jgi:hypothetical protein
VLLKGFAVLDIEALNAECACVTLDRAELCRALEAEVGNSQFCRDLVASHPTLISALPVFVSGGHIAQMAQTIMAIERVARMPAYRAAALAGAPAIAARDPGAAGVLMGYDFHLGARGPRLIEINTNAGGALINAFIGRAQKACCDAVDTVIGRRASVGGIDLAPFVEMFRKEMVRQRGGGAPLKRIAIVDERPEEQYLYPEFVLFQHLLKHHGIEAVIASPERLEYRERRVVHDGLPIDLIYNRLTDFSLSEPSHATLRTAYANGDVVVTPHPHVHALLADKRNLVRLSDSDLLRAWGVGEADITTLEDSVPRTIIVTGERADELWRRRASLFFKPWGGYGGKAAYRGDKLTRRVWEEILAGGYVAQDLVAPSARVVVVDGERKQLKVDIRNYTYDGRVMLVAARLYQGQTTNFRTPGGGFAPVLTGHKAS